MQLRHHVVGFGHCLNHIVGEGRWVWRGEANAFETLDCAAGSKQLGKSALIAKFDAIGVHVLAEKSYLDNSFGHKRSNFSHYVFRAAVSLFTAEGWDYAKSTGVIAADRNANPSRESGIAFSRQAARKSLKRFDDFNLCLVVVPSSLKKRWQ